MAENKRVVVWGTGNVGNAALRAVLGHRGLTLAGVVVSNPDKVGKDAADLAGMAEPSGIRATDDAKALLASGDVDAVVYSALIENRFEQALGDILMCLRMGASVVTSGLYPLQHPRTAPAALLALVEDACAASGASLMVSGIDPGWNMDIMPVLLSAVSSDVTELRAQEVMNYRHYDQPDIVRNVVGLGQPMDVVPPMLTEESLGMVWAPMVYAMGDAVNCPVDDVTYHVERRPLERDIDVPGMGLFEAGTMGAFRFEVVGHTQGKPMFVVEHVTRIDNDCAPDWAYPGHGEGSHNIIVTGNPVVTMTCHSDDPYKPGPGAGGNATAACRLVNAIPYVCAAPAGVVTAISVPLSHNGYQMRV
jgi:hypothetical protein